jgi:hypothetical protein
MKKKEVNPLACLRCGHYISEDEMFHDRFADWHKECKRKFDLRVEEVLAKRREAHKGKRTLESKKYHYNNKPRSMR